MAARENWAKMAVATGGGGTGTLTLEAVSGFPTFTQAFGTGTTSVAYVASGTGVREAGTATFDGTALTLASRTVTRAWNGTTFGTSAQDIPVGAEVYCDLIAQTAIATDGNVEVPGTLIADDSIPVAKLESADLLDNASLQDALGVPNTDGKKCDLLFTLYDVANGTYILDPKATFPYTIDGLVIDSLDNTATANVRIGSTSVTGLGSVSVTTTLSDTNATAANSVVAGNEVNIVLTSIGSTASLVGKLRVTRG